MLYLTLDQRKAIPQGVSRRPGATDMRFFKAGCFERRYRVTLRIPAQQNALSGISRFAREMSLSRRRKERDINRWKVSI